MATLAPAQADDFWQAFRAHELRLAALAPAEFVCVAGDMLRAFAPSLSIELDGGADSDAHRRLLRVTAHGNSARFPDVQTLVTRAGSLALHRVRAFRSRVPQPRFALAKDGLRLATHEVRVCHHNSEGLAGLEIALPPLAPGQQALAQRMVHEMLAHVLGEWDLAIRVGPIAFVPELARHRLPCPLSEYAATFDAFMTGTMGYTGQFPIADEGPWRMQPLHDAHDRHQQLLVINEGARAVAMRPDLGHAVWWALPVWDEASLIRAHDAQHAVAMQLQRERTGVLALATVDGGQRRAALYHASDPREVLRATESQGFADAAQAMSATWEPRWRPYREAERIGAQLAQTPDSLFAGLGLL